MTQTKLERKSKKIVVSISYQDVAADGLTKQLTVHSWGNGEIVTAAWMAVKTAWDGGDTVTASVGITGDLVAILTAQDAKSTGIKSSKGDKAKGSYLVFADGTALIIEFTSTVSKLDQATQGSLELHLIVENTV